MAVRLPRNILLGSRSEEGGVQQAVQLSCIACCLRINESERRLRVAHGLLNGTSRHAISATGQQRGRHELLSGTSRTVVTGQRTRPEGDVSDANSGEAVAGRDVAGSAGYGGWSGLRDEDGDKGGEGGAGLSGGHLVLKEV